MRFHDVQRAFFRRKYYLFAEEKFMINTFQEYRILQYNVHKSKNKIMMILLNEKSIRNYDILMIQKSWRFHERMKMYNSRGIDFTLKNNKKKICFYINNHIDSNSWHNIKYFKNIEIIILQLRQRKKEIRKNSMNMKIYIMNIHEVYNLSSVNHNKISLKIFFSF